MSFMAYDFDLACALERESAFVRPEVLAGPEHDCLARRRTTTELQSVVNMRSFKAIFTAMAGPVALARLPQDVYVVGSLPCLCLSPPSSLQVEHYTRAWEAALLFSRQPELERRLLSTVLAFCADGVAARVVVQHLRGNMTGFAFNSFMDAVNRAHGFHHIDSGIAVPYTNHLAAFGPAAINI